MGDIDYNKIVGVNVDLDEWKSILNERKTPYIEIHDVKNFQFHELEIKEKNIPILLLMQSSGWRPKNASGWGSSGPDGEGGYDIEGYGLTNEEIRELIGHLLDDQIEFRTTEKNMRQWKGDQEIIPPVCQHIVTKNSCDREKERKLDAILREAATKKFKSKDTTRRSSITINGCTFEYTSIVTERIGEANSGLTFALYFYDENGKYVKAYNYPAIWG